MPKDAGRFWRRAEQSNQRGSRICTTTWGTGCPDHDGKACRCSRAKKHRGDHECDCGGECARCKK
ncbi:hypothetical protein ACU635_50695 [[Actinomadura] parvosata]|uniref:hypothetical protein n=1 Tax=[Actinomadura] parvosata TaxID=1955412 RepID=UPI00406C1CF0